MTSTMTTSQTSTIKLLLVEDQTLVRDALGQLLGLQTDFEVVASVEDGLAAQAFLLQADVDIVLSDIEMPRLDGLALCDWIKKQKPQIKTLILTTYNRSGYIARAVKSGAMGFVLKEVPVDRLAGHIRDVAGGKRAYDAELVMAGLEDRDPLNAREREALRLAEQGLSSARIARAMGLSDGTVRNYLSESIGKLYANSRVEAARIARDKGWL